MSQPNFFSEGSSPRRSDTLWKIEEKILGAIDDGGGGGGGGGGSATVGTGSPEGVVTATPGQFYWDSQQFSLWIKNSGTGNTGWIQVI